MLHDILTDNFFHFIPMPAKKKTAAKKAAAKKAPVKKAAAKKAVTKKVAAKKAVASKATRNATPQAAPVSSGQTDERTREIVLNARKRTSTPAHFKTRKKGNTPVMFTMEDVADILQRRGSTTEKAAPAAKVTKKAVKSPESVPEHEVVQPRNHHAASLADILGFDPSTSRSPVRSASDVPAKWKVFYDSLIELRKHLRQGLDLHTSETLHRSSRDDSGDLSGYGQHMADAGTDAFDRDFALSLVSSEQEALYEIEQAIERIFDGSYGVCEITGEAITEERLGAVPFTRYSLEGQRQLEKTRRASSQRGGVFTDVDDDFSIGDDDDN